MALDAKSVINLVNLVDEEVRFKIYFQKYSGEPLELSIAGIGGTSALRGSIQPRGLLTVETTGLSPDLNLGYAILFNDTDASAGLNVGATLTVKSRRDEPGEATAVISEAFHPRSVMPFDTSSAALTLIAVVNLDPTEYARAEFEFRNEAGEHLGEPVYYVDLPPLGGFLVDPLKTDEILYRRRGTVEVNLNRRFGTAQAIQIAPNSMNVSFVGAIALKGWNQP